MSLAPIILFVYNRPVHTRKTVEALQKNELASNSDLVVFSDGPKPNEESQRGVREVRSYLRKIDGFKSIKIIERLENFGLAKSIISGVTEVLEKYDGVIVLEDDLLTSRHFLKYMNNALKIYEKDDEVVSIHGYIYPVKKPLTETFFLKGADCWGWGTWKRGWKLFEADGSKLLKEIEDRQLIKEFDFTGSYPYTEMLRDQIAGRNNSWAIRWYASAFLKNKLTLYPGKSLVFNAGFDGGGTHCRNGDENNFNETNQIENIKVEVKRIETKENIKARLIIIDYFKNQPNFLVKVRGYLKRIFKYVFKN